MSTVLSITELSAILHLEMVDLLTIRNYYNFVLRVRRFFTGLLQSMNYSGN
eukprot:COSAG02_NODE_1193_length_13958_cov_4.939029_3_plen_51_part_00